MSSYVNFHALGQILWVGLLCGAGLPALFAVGLKALSLPGGRTAGAGTVSGAPAGLSTAGGPDEDRVIGGNPAGIAAAAVCFLIVLAAIGWGIYFIVDGT